MTPEQIRAEWEAARSIKVEHDSAPGVSLALRIPTPLELRRVAAYCGVELADLEIAQERLLIQQLTGWCGIDGAALGLAAGALPFSADLAPAVFERWPELADRAYVDCMRGAVERRQRFQADRKN